MIICADYQCRRRRIYRRLLESEATAYYTSHLSNLYYLTGFKGTSGRLLLLNNCSYLFLDGRYRNYGDSLKAADLKVVLIENGDLFSPLNSLLTGQKTDHIWLEKKNLAYESFCRLKKRLKVKKRTYGEDWVEKLRWCKDSDEIELMETAAGRTLKIFKKVKERIEPGITEFELNRFVRVELEKYGESRAFYPLTLFAERISSPHSPPSDKKLRTGDAVLVDIGLKYGGYCSDLTRMFFCGTKQGISYDLYRLSSRASCRAFELLQPGEPISGAAKAARDLIIDEGYKKGLRHGLGHSLGLDIHEQPSLKCGNDRILEEGMVVTVEPGIYLDGRGGGRIEHMVLVTSSGPQLIDEPDSELKEELEFYGNTK